MESLWGMARNTGSRGNEKHIQLFSIGRRGPLTEAHIVQSRASWAEPIVRAVLVGLPRIRGTPSRTVPNPLMQAPHEIKEG